MVGFASAEDRAPLALFMFTCLVDAPQICEASISVELLK